MRRHAWHLGLLFLAALLLPQQARAEVAEVRITKQPGIIYLAVIVMEQQKLVDKAAERLGLPLHATFLTFGGGGAATDALLSGNVDIVTTGASNMLLLWDRTRGQVKGLAGSSATPMWFISGRPDVKSLKDLTAADRIAVPTVKVSSQAIILQIAARKLFGDADFAHFDGMTVTLGHPDAQAALTNQTGITAHFSGAPYQAAEAAAPGLHVVTTSDAILGGAYSNAVYFAGAKFHDANPTVIRAFMTAAAEASAYIANNPREACALYLKVTGEKGTVEDMLAQIGDPKNQLRHGSLRHDDRRHPHGAHQSSQNPARPLAGLLLPRSRRFARQLASASLAQWIPCYANSGTWPSKAKRSGPAKPSLSPCSTSPCCSAAAPTAPSSP